MNLFSFTEENLANALTNQYTSIDVIKSKNHFQYLKSYLTSNEINAQTIVVENDYISKDFFQDYASYYAFCFEQYPKFCKRVHFFSKSFTLDEFKDIILNSNNQDSFWDSYLGFIVVKPIPVTIIGYTILKTYSNSQNFDNRNFWGIRKYKVHLFGNEIEFDSLAFQEQDTVLAACATTAIWSMLNKASIDFNTVLKSPSQITKDADNVSPDGSRLFPNRGLNHFQICKAILNSGLVSEIKNDGFIIKNKEGKEIAKVVSNNYLKKILNAYSPIGIPIILVVSVPIGDAYGLHAITISGFKQNQPIAIQPKDEISWLANNIEKIYAHDDQWGPFVKIDFKDDCELITPWDIDKPTFIQNIIVPIFPKIRISYEDIEAIVLGLDTILSLFFDKKIISDLVWDIKIDLSENHKIKIKQSVISDEIKLAKIIKCQPKYIWIATCYIDKFKILDFTFDATDVGNGMIGKDVVSYLPDNIHQELIGHLKLNQNILQNFFRHIASINYYEFLIKNI